ncbi:hypothetical protein BYT27DRAFT_7313774, partial [Phlegmacium glaucopus]
MIQPSQHSFDSRRLHDVIFVDSPVQRRLRQYFMAFIPLDRVARLAFFSDLTHPIFSAKHAIYFTMMLVGDAIVSYAYVYRCYLIWNCNFWIVVFPILCSLGSGACAYQTIWAIRHFSFHIRLEHNMSFVIFSPSPGANFIATCAYRSIKQTLSISSENSMTPIVRIVIESGTINTAYLFAYTIIHGIHSQYLTCHTMLVGIIFATVILRAGLAAELDARTNIGLSEAPVFAAVGSISQDDSQNSGVTAQGIISSSPV